MSSLGTPTRRPRSQEEILRDVLATIREIQIKQQGLKTETPKVTVSVYEKIEMSDANPVITTTTGIGNYLYDNANSLYEESDYA